MSKEQEALDNIKNVEIVFQKHLNYLSTVYKEEVNVLQELIDLHEPKEIKVGQVWECLIEVGLIGEYESEWAVKGTAVEISSITLKNVVGIIKDRGWGMVVYLSKDLLNSSCFKLVKDVE